MNLLTLLVISLVVYFLFFQEINRGFKSLRSGPTEPPKLPTDSKPTYVRHINIEGAEVSAAPSNLSSYGIASAKVADCRRIAGPVTMTPYLVTCLQHIHQEGGTRGLRIAELLYHQKMVKKDEFIYFVLTNDAQPQLYTFVD